MLFYIHVKNEIFNLNTNLKFNYFVIHNSEDFTNRYKTISYIYNNVYYVMHIISYSTTHRISIFLLLLSCIGSNIVYNLNYLIIFILLSTYYLIIIRMLLYTWVHKIIICPLKYIIAYR